MSTSKQDPRDEYKAALTNAASRKWAIYPYVYKEKEGSRAYYYFVVIKNSMFHRRFKVEKGSGVIEQSGIEFQEFIGEHPKCKERRDVAFVAPITGGSDVPFAIRHLTQGFKAYDDPDWRSKDWKRAIAMREESENQDHS